MNKVSIFAIAINAFIFSAIAAEGDTQVVAASESVPTEEVASATPEVAVSETSAAPSDSAETKEAEVKEVKNIAPHKKAAKRVNKKLRKEATVETEKLNETGLAPTAPAAPEGEKAVEEKETKTETTEEKPAAEGEVKE